MGLFIGTYATYQVNTDCFLKAYCIYGDTHLSFFTCFFNEISLLYVHSLNKRDKVCNAVSPVVCVNRLDHVHVELGIKYLTLQTAVDKTILISE